MVVPASDVVFVGDVRGSVHLYRQLNFSQSTKAQPDCITYMEWSDGQLFVLSKNANIKMYSIDLELIESVKMP